ncbi:hypothetical protein [Pseudanabaena sp. PCC 6802]|uniref:hypothetical protein n=1 Tax=Pseudanabaena sp. PCC 6802 TaxID=118173 RepID=UPI00034839D9|nr:hypothetical protein [Pseudanabaena sp. PCC 6802]
MSCFPIILIPPEVQGIQSELPALPIFTERSPVLSASEPQPVDFFKAVIEIALLIAGTSLIYRVDKNLGTIVLLIGLGAIFTYQHLRFKSYKQRLQRYNRILAGYFTSLETYARKQAQHESKVAVARSPNRLREYRRAKLLELLKQVSSNNRVEDATNITLSGIKSDFARVLTQYFPNSTHVGCQVEFPDRSLTLDFAYIDPETNLHIAIALDETDEPQGLLPNEEFDRYLLDAGWVVMRFSAFQVGRSPDSCCKAIAGLIDELLGDRELIHKFSSVQDLQSHKEY